MNEDDNEFMLPDQKPRKPKPIQTTNIRVIVKARPLLASQAGEKECVTVKENTVEISDPPHIIRQTVDKAFSKQSTQKQLYEYVSPTIEKVKEGFNVTILSYGQTGSGKTYTMFGSDWDTLIQQDPENKAGKRQTTFFGNIESDENFAGLIPRCMHHLFGRIYNGKKNVSIYCSFLQMYNEKLIDLLDITDKQLIIHQNKTDGIYVEGLCETKVSTFEECVNLMKRGERNRTVRQTHMNVKSSRSHSIFQFVIEEVFPNKTFRRTKLNLCDLAGSEKINKAEEMEIIHFKELKNINLSLTTLGKVIWSLSSKDSSVPSYRESKLTRLLQDSLGGNTYTTIIGNISPKYSSIEETLNTLKFVQRARQVHTEVFVKNYKQQPELFEMQKQINYLRSVLKMKRLPGEQKELAQRVKQLQQENKRLKRIADQQAHSRLIEENQMMKLQLQRLQVQRVSVNSPSGFPGRTLITLDHKSQQSEVRKLMTSQTIQKRSTNSTHLPQIPTNSRYTNRSSQHQQKQTNVSLNSSQNIILRRLDMIQRMKSQNRERLQRKLRELETTQKLSATDKTQLSFGQRQPAKSRNDTSLR